MPLDVTRPFREMAWTSDQGAESGVGEEFRGPIEVVPVATPGEAETPAQFGVDLESGLERGEATIDGDGPATREVR